MSRTRKHTEKVWSSVSDEQLAAILSKEYSQCPSDFSANTTDEIGSDFIVNTSARGIEPMKKWL